MLTQVARKAQAILARQSNIQEYDVRNSLLDAGTHRRGAIGGRNVETVTGKVIADQFTDIGVVIDDQDLLHVLVFPCSSKGLNFPNMV